MKKSGIPNYIGHSSHKVFYRTTGGLYRKVFTDFSPKFFLNGKEGHSSRETFFSVHGIGNNIQFVGLLSSTTFWWWYTITSNLRDMNPSDIHGFRFGNEIIENRSLLDISKTYIEDLEKNSEMLQRIQKNKGVTETQSFKILLSKPIIDRIDEILAEHYGFTEEELDFIINYDIKYRMGKELENGEE